MSAELITINVWLGGRSYRISIKPEEEEAVRKAVKIADEKVIALRTQYAGRDDQDFLAMCLLMYASDNAIEPLHNPVMQSELKEMSDKIDQVLGDNN
ncbi:MAG: cell division protein ZapA [Bacteroidota bacterium]